MIRPKTSAGFVIIVFLLSAWKLTAGILTHEGDNREIWENHSLVVARLTSIPTFDPATSVNTVNVEVLGVAWTDQVVERDISIRYYTGMLGALSDSSDLAKGQTVFACTNKLDGKWWIPTHYIGFMPKGAGIWALKNENDPALQPLLDKIEKICRASLRGEKSSLLINAPTTAP